MDPTGKNHELNLEGIASPFCLLEMKRVVGRMKKGDWLKVTVDDPEVVRSIQRICRYSGEKVMEMEVGQAGYSIIIMKE